MASGQHLPRPGAILWDLDGTLIDQTAAIVRCYAKVITQMGYADPDPDVIKRSLGGPMSSTMRLFVPETELDAAGREFRELFPKIMFDGLIILTGGMELIERAFKARIPQALFTNKHGDTARKVSLYAGFSKYIPNCIGSGDTEWHKPEAALTEYVLERIDAEKDGAVIIGDSPTDVAVAQEIGIACYCVATGAHSVDELIGAGANAAFAGLPALSEALDLSS